VSSQLSAFPAVSCFLLSHSLLQLAPPHCTPELDSINNSSRAWLSESCRKRSSACVRDWKSPLEESAYFLQRFAFPPDARLLMVTRSFHDRKRTFLHVFGDKGFSTHHAAAEHNLIPNSGRRPTTHPSSARTCCTFV